MRKDFIFKLGVTDEACDLVCKYHYSKRPPANVQMVGTWHLPGGLFGDYGEAIAAIFFSLPPTRWAVDVVELSRLVRTDKDNVQLTKLIAVAVKELAKLGRGLCISYADATQGHHGGVYQAASWNYDGQRDRAMDGLIIDGKFVPGRTCNSLWGTRSPERLASSRKVGDAKIEPHYDEGKHLYWKALNTTGEKNAKLAGLKRMAYPKPLHADALIEDLRREGL